MQNYKNKFTKQSFAQKIFFIMVLFCDYFEPLHSFNIAQMNLALLLLVAHKLHKLISM